MPRQEVLKRGQRGELLRTGGFWGGCAGGAWKGCLEGGCPGDTHMRSTQERGAQEMPREGFQRKRCLRSTCTWKSHAGVNQKMPLQGVLGKGVPRRYLCRWCQGDVHGGAAQEGGVQEMFMQRLSEGCSCKGCP